MVNAIVCVDRNWGIGKDNKLLYHIKDDMDFFKIMTTGNICVCGRKTSESIPNFPLKNRSNIVLTNQKSSFEPFLAYMKGSDLREMLGLKVFNQDVFFIGGSTVYKEFLDLFDRIYVTKVYDEKESDSFFPNLDELPEWKIVAESALKKEGDLSFRFIKYERKFRSN